MSAKDRATARKHLDRRLISLSVLQSQPRPPRGWVRAIREALGMSAAQLAARLGVKTPRVYAIEKAEASDSITLKSLSKAADAMGCQLVYALIPRTSLDGLVTEQAERKAKQRLSATRHSMLLEAQPVDQLDDQAQFQRLVQQLIDQGGVALWGGDK